MNITHLKYAVEVAKTGSISQAADNLYMSQPNLSKAIKEFECKLGFTIFKRTSKGIVPTVKGREFITDAQKILIQIEELENFFSKNDTAIQRLSISVPRASYISRVFTEFLCNLDFTNKIEMSYHETNSMDAINSVVNGDYPISIIRCIDKQDTYFYSILDDKGLSHKDILKFRYKLVMSENDELAKNERIDLSMLAQKTELVHGDLSVPFMSMSQLKDTPTKKICGKRIYVYERGSQFDILSDVPNTFMWVSPIPEKYLNRYGLVQKECDTPIYTCKDVLIYPKGYHMSRLEKLFVETLANTVLNID